MISQLAAVIATVTIVFAIQQLCSQLPNSSSTPNLSLLVAAQGLNGVLLVVMDQLEGH